MFSGDIFLCNTYNNNKLPWKFIIADPPDPSKVETKIGKRAGEQEALKVLEMSFNWVIEWYKKDLFLSQNEKSHLKGFY
jgi:hypothetical protein